MSRYGKFSHQVTTQASMVRAIRSSLSTGVGGVAVLEDGTFTISSLEAEDLSTSGITLYLGYGATLKVLEGLSPRFSLSLPEGYVEAVREADSSAPRNLYWSSRNFPQGLDAPTQNPEGYPDLTLWVPNRLLTFYRTVASIIGSGARFRVELWEESPCDIEDQPPASSEYELVDGAVRQPPHYTWLGQALVDLGLSDAANVEAWDVLDAAFPDNPHLWNCGKYLLRQGRKGGERERLEDLRKARQYLDRAIERLELVGEVTGRVGDVDSSGPVGNYQGH